MITLIINDYRSAYRLGLISLVSSELLHYINASGSTVHAGPPPSASDYILITVISAVLTSAQADESRSVFHFDLWDACHHNF